MGFVLLLGLEMEQGGQESLWSDQGRRSIVDTVRDRDKQGREYSDQYDLGRSVQEQSEILRHVE